RAALRFTRVETTFPEALAAALEQEGFSPEEFTGFFKDYARFALRANEGELDRAVEQLRAALVGPLSLLLHVGHERTWFVTLAQPAPADAPPPETHTVAA